MATKKAAKKKQSSKRASTKGKSTKAKSSKRKSSKRTLIAPRGDKRYVRRNKRGEFKESDDVSASLSRDRKKRAKRKAKPGQGDKGD